MNERIEKRIELNVPISRVWRAVTDYGNLGNGFKTRRGFCVGSSLTQPNYLSRVPAPQMGSGRQRMEPERLFSSAWPHRKSQEKQDSPPGYSHGPSTLVEFRLEKSVNSTLVTLIESGFDQLPADRHLEAFPKNGVSAGRPIAPLKALSFSAWIYSQPGL